MDRPSGTALLISISCACGRVDFASLGDEPFACTGLSDGLHDATLIRDGRIALSLPATLGTVTMTCDAGRIATWHSFAPLGAAAYGKPLVSRESGYVDRSFDASALEGYWPFDGTGAVAHGAALADKSGAGADALVVNPDGAGLMFDDGKIGTSLHFDGLDSYLTATLPAFSGEYSLVAWVNLDERATENHILAPGTVQFFVESGGVLESGASGEWNIEGATQLALSRWYHAALVQEPTGWILYLDGREDARGPQIAPAGTALAIGHIFSLLMPEFFVMNGRIDEPAVFSRALAASDVIQLYHRGALRIRYEVRTCDLLPCERPFGAVFSEATSTSVSPAVYDLSGLPPARYAEWRATLETDDPTASPELVDVVVSGRR